MGGGGGGMGVGVGGGGGLRGVGGGGLGGWVVAGGGAFRVKISRGALLEFQNGTQQGLNEMIDLVNFGGQKDRLHAENGRLSKWDLTRSE